MKTLSSYIGIPYLPRGRTIFGTDCWGLVAMVSENIYNIPVPNYDEYSDKENWTEMSDVIRLRVKEWDEVARGEEVSGDVVLLRLRGQPLHVGIVIGNSRMLHIIKGANSVIENYTGPAWNKRVLGIYRYRHA